MDAPQSNWPFLAGVTDLGLRRGRFDLLAASNLMLKSLDEVGGSGRSGIFTNSVVASADTH